MSQVLDAIFDGTSLKPTIPLNLTPGTRVRIIVESVEEKKEEETKSFLQTAKSLHLEGNPDWSENLDQYLYSPNMTDDD